VRHAWLQVADSAACVRTAESREQGRHRIERTIEIDRVSVRHRPGERDLLDWLAAAAESMAEGDCRTVSVWVSPLRPAALVHAVPVDPCAAATACRGVGAETARRAPPVCTVSAKLLARLLAEA
jgi:hypothetical protein